MWLKVESNRRRPRLICEEQKLWYSDERFCFASFFSRYFLFFIFLVFFRRLHVRIVVWGGAKRLRPATPFAVEALFCGRPPLSPGVASARRSAWTSSVPSTFSLFTCNVSRVSPVYTGHAFISMYTWCCWYVSFSSPYGLFKKLENTSGKTKNKKHGSSS